MSLQEYEVAVSLHNKRVYVSSPGTGAEEVDLSFNALIMAACYRADADNYRRLLTAFPHLTEERSERSATPDGRLGAERG